LPCVKKKRTTNYLFAVRQHKNARQTIFLPGVFFAVRQKKNAYGKEAPEKMRTTKIKTHSKHRFSVVHACGVVDKSTWKRFVSSSQYNPFDTYTRHVLPAPPQKKRHVLAFHTDLILPP
jgi:hypothetical protein